MAKRVFTYFIAAVLISAGGFLEAQASPAPVSAGSLSGWRVFHTEGAVIVNQGGAKTVFQGQQGASREIILGPRDMVQTGDGKAELQMISGTSGDRTYTVIKLRENTSVLIDRTEDGEAVVELLYGKIRLITGTAASSIMVRAGTSTAFLRNGDAAIDYILSPGVTQPVLSFHFFSGQGELVPRSSPGTEPAKLPLNADESISLESQTPFAYVERKALDPYTVEYWNATPFSSGAPLPMPVSAARQKKAPEPKLAEQPGTETASSKQEQPGQEQPRTEIVSSEQEQPKEEPVAAKREKAPKRERPARAANASGKKHILTIAGVLLAAAGTAVQTYSLVGNPDPKLRDPLFYGSYAPLGVGVGFILVSSILYLGKASSDK